MSVVVSEESSKKRGRPRLMHDKLEEVFSRDTGPYVATRTIQNRYYEIRAFSTLGFTSTRSENPYSWLADNEKQKKGHSSRQGYRRAILSELGRIDNDEDLLAVASMICEIKPKAREAVQLIRRMRTGKDTSGDWVQLANELIRAINDYRQRHPSMSEDDVLTALEGVKGVIEAV